MSFMPDVGARVVMDDGREAVVSNIDPLGKDDRVKFDDGHEEKTTAWNIVEILDVEKCVIDTRTKGQCFR